MPVLYYLEDRVAQLDDGVWKGDEELLSKIEGVPMEALDYYPDRDLARATRVIAVLGGAFEYSPPIWMLEHDPDVIY